MKAPGNNSQAFELRRVSDPVPNLEADRKWHACSAKARGFLKVRADFAPWTSQRGIRLIGVHGQRERDMIDIAFVAACQKAGLGYSPCSIPKLGDLQVNLSQSVARKPWSVGAKLATQTTSSKTYSFLLDRVLLAADTLGTLGYPNAMLDAWNEQEAKSLTGEAIAVQCMATVLHSLMMAVNFPGLFAGVRHDMTSIAHVAGASSSSSLPATRHRPGL